MQLLEAHGIETRELGLRMFNLPKHAMYWKL
jgi:hypothetical protein